MLLCVLEFLGVIFEVFLTGYEVMVWICESQGSHTHRLLKAEQAGASPHYQSL